VKAFEEQPEQLLPALRGGRAVVLDRIGDPAQQIAHEDGFPEIPR
jgi:hypothetical protein